MINSNGRRVFTQIGKNLVCYSYNVKLETWQTYGSHYQTGAKKDGIVVISNENDTSVDIGFVVNDGGNRVIAHDMGTQNIDFYEINQRTKVWTKLQTFSGIELGTTTSGKYAMDFKGDHVAIYVNNSTKGGDLHYYAFNSSTRQYVLKFTIANVSGISPSNTDSIRNVSLSKNGSRIIISDTNGNYGSIGGEGSGVCKIIDVDQQNYTYTTLQTITATDENLFGYALDMNFSGERFIVSESISEKYHVYEYDTNSSSFTLSTSLDTYNANALRYHNSISMSGLGDVVFIGEIDPDGAEEGIVFGYYLDASDAWTELEEISGNFLSNIDGSNVDQEDISFGTTDEFGKIVHVNAMGTELLIGSSGSSQNSERSFIVLQLASGPGVTPPSLSDMGVSVEEMATVDVKPEMIVNSGYTTSELKDAGVSVDTMIDGGASQVDLVEANYSVADIAKATDDLSSLFDTNSTVNADTILNDITVSDVLEKNVSEESLLSSVSDLISSFDPSLSQTEASTIDFSQFKAAGVSATQLKNIGADAALLASSSFSASDLVSAGFSVSELANANIDAKDLKGAGLSVADLESEFLPEDLVKAAFDDSAFEAAGYQVIPNKTISKTVGGIELTQEVKPIFKNDNISDLTTDMPDEADLEKLLSQNPSVGAVLTVKATDADGNNISDINDGPIVLTLDFPNLDPTESNVLYKFDDSFNKITPQPTGYPVTLTYNEETGKYTGTLTNLSTMGAAVFEGYEGDELYSAFIATDVANGGYTNQKYHTLFWISYNLQVSTGFWYPRSPDYSLATANFNMTNYSEADTLLNSFHSKYTQITTALFSHANLKIHETVDEDTLNEIYDIITEQAGTMASYTYNRIYTTTKLNIEITEEGPMTISTRSDGNFITRLNNTPVYPDLSFVIYYDITPPEITLSSDGLEDNGYTNSSTVNIILEANEKINTFDESVFSLQDCTISSITQLSDLSYNIAVVPTKEGLCKIDLPSETISDLAGNFAESSFSFQFNYDKTPPSLVLSSTNLSESGLSSNDSYITMIVTPSETCNGFDETSISITNGSLFGAVSENSNGTFQFNVTPLSGASMATVEINILENATQDLAGNESLQSNSFVWYYDKLPPSVTISSSTLSGAGTYTNIQTIDLSFVISEEVDTFTESSITVTGGSISEFTGSGVEYSCKITPPDINVESAITVSVESGAFTDLVGNDNIATESYHWTYDPIGATITISSTSIESGNASNDQYLPLSVTSNEEIVELGSSSFTISNGYVSDITGSGASYTAKLYPQNKNQISVYIASGTIQDLAGNTNPEDTNTFLWTYDGTTPIITLSTSSLDYSNETTSNSITVSLNITETDVVITENDLTYDSNMSSVSNFSGSNGYYTFTHTALVVNEGLWIYVGSNTISDSAGNSNPKSNIIEWTFKRDPPSVVLSHDTESSGFYSNESNITLNITTSNAVTGFESSDISVQNGSVSYFSGSGDSYTAVIVPTNVNSVAEISASIAESVMVDEYNLQNTVSNTFIWNYDPIPPTVEILSSVESGNVDNVSSVDLSFVFSKAVTGFALANITKVNAILDNLVVDGNTFGCRLTPDYTNSNETITSKISVPSSIVTDTAGNQNTASATEFVYTYDGTVPTIQIYGSTQATGATSDLESIDVILQSSETITNFSESDIVVSNASITSFSGSGAQYYATITRDSTLPDDSVSTITLYVDVNSFSDEAGNINDASSNTFTWYYDPTVVELTISELNGLASGSTTADDYITVQVTSNLSIVSVDQSKMVVTGGSASITGTTDNVVTVKLTPETSNTASQIYFDTGFITSTNSKINKTASSTYIWTYDGVAPIVTLSSTNTTNNTVTSEQVINMVATISETPSSFTTSDIAVTNGTVSNLSGSGTQYTFDVTITSEGQVTVYIPTDNGITDTAGNVSVPYNDFIVTYDGTQPSVDISFAIVNDGTYNATAFEAATENVHFNSYEYYLRMKVSEPTNISTSSFNITNATMEMLLYPNSTDTYLIIVTPNTGTYLNISLELPVASYEDEAGNVNGDSHVFNWIHNERSPSLLLYSTISSGSESNASYLGFRIRASEVLESNSFTVDDITVTNGSLSNFVNINDIAFTVDITPISDGVVSVLVDQNKYKNLAGNANEEIAEFSWTSNTTPITCVITGDIPSGTSSSDNSVLLTFTLNKDTTISDLENAVSVTNGSISSITSVNNSLKVFNATLTPLESNTTAEIVVPASTLTDSAGNQNTSASNTFSWTYIGTNATVSITTSSVLTNSISKTDTITLNIALNGSETYTLTESDISFTNGSITSFSGSNNAYTLSFQSLTEGETSTIFVPENSFTDSTNTPNNISNIFSFSYDSTLPTMVISSSEMNSGEYYTGNSINLIFTASESISDFALSDLIINNGTIESLTSSDNIVYYANLTPDISDGDITVSVPANSYTDAAGNENDTASNTFTWKYDNIVPTITISSPTITSGSTSSLTSIEIDFTLSEEVQVFNKSLVSVTNGTLSDITGSGTSYSATLTPNAISTVSLQVPAGNITDLAGNTNDAASNTFSYDFYTDEIFIKISESNGSSSGFKTASQSVEYKISISNTNTPITSNDITLTNASISSFELTSSIGTLLYTVVLVPVTANVESSIIVAEDTIFDVTNTGNIASNEFKWTYDTSPPVITISSNDMTSGDTNKLSSIVLRFTSDEDMVGFSIADITRVNCTLSDFVEVSKTEYTATCTPNVTNGEILVYVNSDAVTDEAGNTSAQTSNFIWNYDGVSPIVVITSTNGDIVSGSITNISSSSFTATVTNESAFTLTSSLFTKVNGSIGGITQVSDTVYTFTFTIDTPGIESSFFIAENSFTDSANNGNIASNTFSFTYDAEPLTYTAVMENMSSGDIINDTPVKVTYTFSESVADFTSNNFDLTNISSHTLTGSGTTYIGTFYANENSVATVEIPSTSLVTSNAISKDISSNTLNWRYDTSLPVITLTGSHSNNATNNNSYLDLTITSSEELAEFTDSNITVIGDATLSNLDGSGSQYTVRVTPQASETITISILQNAVQDLAGNYNNEAVSFVWNYDNEGPSITINSGSITNGSTVTSLPIDISFSFSEDIQQFNISDINVSNAFISDLSYTGSFYTAFVNPTSNNQTITVDVGADKILDVAGNYNSESSNQLSFTFQSDDILVNLTSSDISNGDSYKNSSITMILEASEDIYFNQISVDDFDVSNGTISNITQPDSNDNTKYHLTLTATNQLTETRVKVNESSLVAINTVSTNVQSGTFVWTYDATPPTITIASDDINSGSTSNDNSIDITLTASEDLNNFLSSDITLLNATISNFTGSGSQYNATITPSVASGAISIQVGVGSIQDSVNNANTVASNEFIWNYDSVAPVLTFSSDDVQDSSSTDLSSVSVTLSSTKSLSNMEEGKISIKNGIISDFTSVSSSEYTFNVSSSNTNANKTVTISIDSESVQDEYGNTNTESSNSFTFTINKEDTGILEVTEIVTSLTDDMGVSFDDIGVSETVFSNTATVFLANTVTEGETLSIGNISGMENSKVFSFLVDQLLTRNSVSKVSVAKDDIPFNDTAVTKLGSRQDIKVVKSNSTVSFTDIVSDTDKESSAFYCPVPSIDDFIEIVIETTTYKITRISSSQFSFQLNGGAATNYDEGDTFTINGYVFVFGSITVINDNTDNDDNNDASGNTNPFIPCFREGTQILTKDGYISVEHLDASKHTLVDDHGRYLTLLKTKRFTKPYDGKSFPYVVPAGSKLSEEFQCTQDLHVTYNHCIYLPHMNKYMPPWKMNIPQDRREVSGYVFYHVYTENYFADVIMANGIPCETISDPVMETKIMNPSYPPELKQEILQKVMKACDFNPSDCSRTRMTRKQFNKLVYKIKSKWNKQSKMAH